MAGLGCIEHLPVPEDIAEARCGDGVLHVGEACDDGNLSDRDGCTNLCVLAACNDGIHRLDLADDDPAYEDCDDGNRNENDGCTTLCQQPACHDGIKQNWEACDDGNTDNTDACVGECVRSSCGDGYVEDGVEQCDPAADNGDVVCDDQCRIQQCGDATLEGDEACDDGNDDDTDACRNNCTLAVCGDGVRRTDTTEGERDYEACDGDDRPEDARWCSVECRIDDHGNSPQAATPIAQDETLEFHLATGDEDWFQITAPVSGLYRFEVPTQPGLGGQNSPTCHTQKGDNDTGLEAAFENSGCDLAIEATAGETVYFRLRHGGNENAEEGSVRLFPICGNGRRDEDEQCDPSEGLTARFDCRSDCRTRHRASVGLGTICDLHQGGLRCWGSNEHLLLGDQLQGRQQGYRGYYNCTSQSDETRPYSVPAFHLPQWVISAGSNVRYVGSSRDRACAILGNGRMRCWGNGQYMQPHYGGFDHRCNTPNQEPECEPVPTDMGADQATIGLSIGAVHQCVIFKLGQSSASQLQCWGYAANGALGAEVSGDLFTDAIDYSPVSHPQDKDIVYVSLGTSFGCFIDADEQVYCWGRNDQGSLGIGTSQQQGGCATACERLPQPVQGLGRVVSLSTGDFHTCALNRQGEVWCWGLAKSGQTGAAADPNPCRIDNQDYACNRRPQRVVTVPQAVDIATGDSHSCALTREGAVWCWGDNRYGQLGIGVMGTPIDGEPVEPTGTRTPQWIATLPAADALSVGGFTSCAHVGESLWCWGLDDMQQISVQQDPPQNNRCGEGAIPTPRRLGNRD